ncbi:MAG: ADP-ribosyltransferase [Mycetocola sp.]
MDYPAKLVDRDLVKGNTLTWSTFTSTSVKREKAIEFATGTNGTLLEINVTRGRDLQRLSVFHSGEGEVLLLPGAQFTVASVGTIKLGKFTLRHVVLQQTK